MENKIEIGDVVKVKGQHLTRMTVEYTDDDYADCVWFTIDDVLQRGSFKLQLLEKVAV